MNQLQIRLLLETEFKFYQLQDLDTVVSVLVTHGYKRNPNLALISDEKLKILLAAVRKSLRS